MAKAAKAKPQEPVTTSIEVHRDIPQNSEAWFRLRMGIPTSSAFKDILATPSGRANTTPVRTTYMHKLAGEILSGEPSESYKNGYMERGHAMENDIRTRYRMIHDTDTDTVAFVKNWMYYGSRGTYPIGCSPDDFVGNDGLLEIKTMAPHLLVPLLLDDNPGFPSKHEAQCQGQIWVTEREWCDLVIGYSGMPYYERRAYRDDNYIRNLQIAVSQFHEELQELVEKVRRLG